ncbi:MAG: glycosyltransferase [Acidobacteriaceae bacterium]|nr:glycosyltransferase [Acidobacteriaceae bacterium]
MKRVPYPGATSILSLPEKLARKPGLLPKNIRLLEDENTQEAQVRILSRAKLVVLPILTSNMAASGLSVGLNAMGLGKCVITTEGPAFSGICSNEVLFVPPGDPVALAEMIRRAWEDDELRRVTATRAHEYALKSGGRDELYQRIIDAIGFWHQSRIGVSVMRRFNEAR